MASAAVPELTSVIARVVAGSITGKVSPLAAGRVELLIQMAFSGSKLATYCVNSLLSIYSSSLFVQIPLFLRLCVQFIALLSGVVEKYLPRAAGPLGGDMVSPQRADFLPKRRSRVKTAPFVSLQDALHRQYGSCDPQGHALFFGVSLDVFPGGGDPLFFFFLYPL